MMAELHPFFVHFPIALILVASGFDLFAVLWKHAASIKVALILQVIAAVSSILVALSGNQAELSVTGEPSLTQYVDEALQTHVTFGNASIWIMVLFVLGRSIAILEKRPWAQEGWIFPGISFSLAILIMVTGLYGGALSREILQYYITH
ncbi:MAG: hypothetical protein K9N35_05370 [Candidatus Marinimicrobia bacterium]|nr:hypothetical protein [Candidatus Neomarinimicrobiota bacterium]